MNLTIGLVRDFARRKNAPLDSVLKFRFTEWDHATTGWGFTTEYLPFVNQWGDDDWRKVDAFVICLWDYRPWKNWFQSFEGDRDGFLNNHTATLEEFLDATKDARDDVEIVFKTNSRRFEDPAVQIKYSLPFYHATDEPLEKVETPKELAGTLLEYSFQQETARVAKSVWNWYDYRPAISIFGYWKAIKDYPLDCIGAECFNTEYVDRQARRYFVRDRRENNRDCWNPPEYRESAQTRRIIGTALWDDFEGYKQEEFLRERDLYRPFIQRAGKWEEALKTEQLKEIRERIRRKRTSTR